MADIVRRRGQAEWRRKLLAAHDEGCAISGCNGGDALEGALIPPCSESAAKYVSNGLLFAPISTQVPFLGL